MCINRHFFSSFYLSKAKTYYLHLMGCPVSLYVYDLSKGLARLCSHGFLGQHIDGVWHTSVVVYGREFFYGSMGIESCPPSGTILGQPDEEVGLGDTEIPFEMFQEYLSQMGNDCFRGEKYSLFEHNCNTFSLEVSQFLTGKSIPSYITELPSVVLGTPLGQIIKDMMESINVTSATNENNTTYN